MYLNNDTHTKLIKKIVASTENGHFLYLITNPFKSSGNQ
jgi:hypothetical protein